MVNDHFNKFQYYFLITIRDTDIAQMYGEVNPDNVNLDNIKESYKRLLLNINKNFDDLITDILALYTLAFHDVELEPHMRKDLTPAEAITDLCSRRKLEEIRVTTTAEFRKVIYRDLYEFAFGNRGQDSNYAGIVKLEECMTNRSECQRFPAGTAVGTTSPRPLTVSTPAAGSSSAPTYLQPTTPLAGRANSVQDLFLSTGGQGDTESFR